MLEAKNLSVSYGQHRALENATVRIARGETVAILGANGAGKSSLLKAICGICEGSVSGTVTMNGSDLTAARPDRIVEAGIALVPEGRGIFPELTVRENLSLGAYSAHARDGEKSNIERIFTLFPVLRERQRQVARTMSGGEQQMVAIGRAMMSSPSILLLDEPSLGLSPILCRSLFQSLKAISATGIGILLVEQNAKQSLAIADRGYVLENGLIVKEASAAELMNDPAVQKAYLGAAGAAAPETAHRPPVAAPAARPAARPAVEETAMKHRPAGGASPMDIAAAAMAKFTPAAPGGQQSKPAAGRAPAPPAFASPPATAANGSKPPAAGPRDVEIDNLVERASARSAQAFNRPVGSRPAARPGGNGATPPRPNEPVRMPDLSDSGSRLRDMLAEIEAAAEKARKYRPSGGGN